MKKEEFKKIYDFCQTLSPKVKRSQIVPKLVEITGGTKIRVIKTDLDVNVCRGYFLNATNTQHPFVRDHGLHVVVLARGMNPCWDRFVNTKEIMHLFDDANEFTNTAESFEKLLLDFEDAPVDLTAPAHSDVRGFWMALACLCPEAKRVEYQEKLAKGQIDHYKIALELRIPQQYVPRLFQSNYSSIVSSLIG